MCCSKRRAILSSVYLGKIFKEETGISVADYITRHRLNLIKRHLEEGRLSTKEILDQCGWEDTNYFYVQFKKHYGVSLTQFKTLYVGTKPSM